MKNDINEVGKIESLVSLIKDEKRIVIPIIQRDYAQGRDNEKVVRDRFLDAIFQHLKNNKYPLELDFIYGSLKDNRYTILDGQQRLTTLFLLHWYFARLENKHEDFNEKFSGKKFTYETRANSTEFCEKLVSEKFDINNLLPIPIDEKQLSKTMENCSWFITSWANDPTVKAMLNMLDAIHQKFSSSINENYFKKLCDGGIVFQFLSLDNFGLTDDLYIKMNSTGIPLSTFENFKANLEQYLKSECKDTVLKYPLKQLNNKEVDFKEYFSFMMDTEWSDLFWAYSRDKEIIPSFDDIIMNFFHIVFINVFYEKDRPKTKSDFIHPNITKPLSCKEYSELEVITQGSIEDIIVFLDIIKNDDKTQKLYLDGFGYYSETEIFNKVLNNKLEYKDRLRFYAYYKYIVKQKQANEEELKEWMRVIHNLTENTSYNDVAASRDIKAINTLIDFSNGILNYIANNEFNGFEPYTRQEEQLKAKLITSDNTWKQRIEIIELHEYFKGEIQFLFNISEITKEVIDSWENKDHKDYQEKFDTNTSIAIQIFNDKPVNPILNLNKKYIWERALLAKGDYLIHNNNNFCTNDKNRDTGWKRFLREKTDILKLVFNDNDMDKNYIPASLQKIIANPDKTDSDGSWCWREQFIKHPELLDYIGSSYRYINRNSVHGFALLSKSNMRSKHWELFSLVFYLKHKGKDFKPFEWGKYEWVSGNANYPYAWLSYKDTDYYLCISYQKDKYEIWFGSDSDPIKKKHIDILVKKHGFNKYSEDDEKSYYKYVETEDKVILAIKELGADLGKS